ncbi:MAG: DMT family transporter [Bacteroidetes bacterium]|nr:DMT family transporter [Bacteroidota bacterium]MBS1741015.1 DMT family transporter [Bacteroidota bacterium]
MTVGLIAMCIATFCFGLTDVLLKKVQSEFPTLPLLIIRSGLSALGLLLLFLCSYYSPFATVGYKIRYKPQAINWSVLPYSIALASVSYFGLFFFMQAIKHSLVSETVGFNKIGVVMGVLIGVMVYKEPFTLQKLICTLIILSGIAILEKQFLLQKNKGISKGLMFVFLARLCWSVGYLFVPYIRGLGVLLFSFVVESVVCAWSIMLYQFDKNKMGIRNWKVKPIFNNILIIALIGIIAEASANMAKNDIPIVLLAFLGLIQPVTTLVFSKLYVGERLNASQWLGIGLGVFGALIFAL